jgi:hypothetical protein
LENHEWRREMSKEITLLRRSLFAVLALAACFVASTVQASTVVVGTCKSGVPQFTTIQAAVTSAPAGSTVEVCPGTYPEQIMITKKLTLIGEQSGTNDAAVVAAPVGGVVQNATDIFGNPVAAQIFVENAVGVTISHLTVDGSANGLSGCSIDLQGIYYQNSTGTITYNVVRNQILDPADQGCQVGLAINVESTLGTPEVTISNNAVRNYQKNGITAAGLGALNPGPSVTVTGNTVIGVGATPAIAQNGIQIGYGATATITTNDVADDIYTGPTYGSSGILVYASTGVTVTGNTVESTQLAIVTAADPTYGFADSATIKSNKIGGTRNYDAIDLCSNYNIAESNVIYGSAQSGIHADDECPGPGSTPSGNSNNIQNNTINEACAGILEGSGTGNVFGPNTFSNVTNTVLAGDSCAPRAGPNLKTAESSGKSQSLRVSPSRR